MNTRINTKKVKGIKDGWFSETEAMYPGQKFSIALEEFSSEKSILFSETSQFQDILVFRSAQYGNVLVLDGVIQLSERDEFAYHEMMTHVPLLAHAHPQNVLIVGGGDGGVLREVCKHDCVQKITMVEIDPMVIEVSKKYFSKSFGAAFDDPRVTIVYEDASEFLHSKQQQQHRKNGDYYDCIFSDTSDPVGPAETLFQPSFYESMHDCLAKGGIVCAQSECMWIHLDFITDIVACCTEIFGHTEYYSTLAPTFPCGQIGFILASKNRTKSCQQLARQPSSALLEQMKYYNPNIHQASFVLPEFVQKKLQIYQSPEAQGEKLDCLLAQCTIS